MEVFGLTIARTKALTQQLQSISGYNRGWWPVIREAFSGAWQQNQTVTVENVTAHVAVFACTTLISSDVGKSALRLGMTDTNDIWSEVENPAFSPVLRKPNGYQIRQQFFEGWQMSKLLNGNTYVLKRRDGRRIVDAMYVLDPSRVEVLQAPDTSVFYKLAADNIAGIGEAVIVPASEIIHDIYTYFSHPLIGVSPIYACGKAAIQGLTIQGASTTFFVNGGTPGGIITAPGTISQPAADRIKAKWDTEFGGNNAGKVAVLGDGLKYDPIPMMRAVDAQLLEQLKFTAEMVCQAFRVPPHKISVGQYPNYNNIQALDTQYYAQCLQEKMYKVQELVNRGLDLPTPYSVRFDLDDLLRMDTATLIDSEKKSAGIKKLNESRKRFNLPPVEGGNTVFMQDQDHAVEWIARRDALPLPDPSAQPPTPTTPDAPDQSPTDQAAKSLTGDDVRGQLLARIAPIAVKFAESQRAA